MLMRNVAISQIKEMLVNALSIKDGVIDVVTVERAAEEIVDYVNKIEASQFKNTEY